MQINGMGSSHNHSMHQVTECKHEHAVTEKRDGVAASSSANNALQPEAMVYTQPERQFSLTSWLKDALSGSKKLLKKIWGESADVAQGVEHASDGVLRMDEQVMAQLDNPKEGQTRAGQTFVGQEMHVAGYEAVPPAVMKQHTLENNPYFSAIEDTGREKQSIWEKVRVKFQSIAGQLMGRFSNKNSFQTKQEKPKEDLRKHSRYREDDLEVDCILTDDSYLMDSYDRKGEYSKLSTKK